MNHQTEEKILNLLREHFNLYHSYFIMGMLTDDNISPQLFRKEVEKIKEANEIIAFCSEKLKKADMEIEKMLADKQENEE